MKDSNQLIQRIAKGDQKAFRLLYDQFATMVYNTAISYMQNPQDAEEVTQDVFTSIFRNATKFKGDSAAGTWIYRITVNTALNYISKRKRTPTLNVLDDSIEKIEFHHPGIILENKESAKYFFKAVDSLPEKQKTAVILSFIEDLPRQKVADIMETSLKAVESLLQRGKKNLKVELEKMYPNRRKTK